jgi:Fe-S-cluster containining protein
MPKELPVLKPLYDCAKCPGYCCSYEYIIVTKQDVKRLGKRFDLTPEEAEQKFTKRIAGYGRVLKHRKDTVYKSTCRFFHPTKRQCTVYEHRPNVCREYPAARRCTYFDFLQWEREHQQDETFVPLAR